MPGSEAAVAQGPLTHASAPPTELILAPEAIFDETAVARALDEAAAEATDAAATLDYATCAVLARCVRHAPPRLAEKVAAYMARSFV